MSATETKRNQKLTSSRATIVREARCSRKAMNHVVRLIEPASREIRGIGEDGLECFDLVRLSDADHLNNLRIALVWLQQAETHARQVRVEIERVLDNNGWRHV